MSAKPIRLYQQQVRAYDIATDTMTTRRIWFVAVEGRSVIVAGPTFAEAVAVLDSILDSIIRGHLWGPTRPAMGCRVLE